METTYIDGAMFKKSLKSAAKFLEKNKEEINSLNVFPVPDGDTGTNMSLTMQSATKQGLEVDSDNVSEIALAASHGSLMGARGNSGVILSQLFRGFALGMEGKEKIDIETLANSFKEASDTAYKAVMKPTEGTILTVARECGEHAQKIARKETDIVKFLREILDHGNLTLNKTPDMLPVLKEAGVVDAGGKGLMAVLTGALNTLSGIEEEEETLEEQEIKFQEVVEHKHLDPDDIKFGYCTEFMVNGDIGEMEVDRFRTVLSTKGDSLMVVQGDNLVKVHVHTNNPGQALEEALKLGALSDIKIDNMRFQHEKVIEKDKDKLESKNKTLSKKYSFVAIATGEGVAEVFEGLNVDVVLEGGQTMNPSTEDIKKAIDKTDGENIFILPNNGNIILAAEQSKELSDRNVIVIPTKTVPQGFAAMFEFNEADSVEENKENMMEGIKAVKTGQITYSVRDTEINGNKIKKDEIIGLSEGEIVANSSNIEGTVEKLLDDMIDEDSSLLTILYGKDIDENDAEELEKILADRYDDMDVELIYGGQPIYYYIFAVE